MKTDERKALSIYALRFLKWIRDNDHYAAGWYPQYAHPNDHTHFAVIGYGYKNKTRIKAETAREAFPYLRVSKNPRRMWDLTLKGKRRVERFTLRELSRQELKSRRQAAAPAQ